MKNCIISLDQAGNTGITISKDETIEELHLVMTNSNYDYVERANYTKSILKKLTSKLEKDKNNGVLIILEDTQLKMLSYRNKGGGFGQKPQNVDTFKKLCKLLGILEAYAIEKGISFKTVNSSEWRKSVGIKGKKREDKKRNAINYVERLGIDLNNILKKHKISNKELYDRKTDLADSVCMCIYGMKKIKIIGRNKNVEVNPNLKLKIHKQK